MSSVFPILEEGDLVTSIYSVTGVYSDMLDSESSCDRSGDLANRG